MPPLPLSELRVVEVGSGDALGYCGKLFADFGAEVIKVEPSGGDAARKIAPLVDAGDGRRESGYFAWLNTNKRSLTADLEQSALVSDEECAALLCTLLCSGIATCLQTLTHGVDPRADHVLVHALTDKTGRWIQPVPQELAHPE